MVQDIFADYLILNILLLCLSQEPKLELEPSGELQLLMKPKVERRPVVVVASGSTSARASAGAKVILPIAPSGNVVNHFKIKCIVYLFVFQIMVSDIV